MRMNEKLIAAFDVWNMLPTCEMILKSALERKESRGAHYRSDYPETVEKWRKNLMCRPASRGIKLSARSIKKVPVEVAEFFSYGKPRTHLLE